MFIGHFAVGFAAKRAAPETSLGWLVAAACFLDLLWPVFLLLGWERVRIAPGDTVFTPLAFESYPVSHSLAAVAGWSIVLGTIYWMLKRDRTGAWAVGLLVASHWVLDVVTHRPDLPVFPGGPMIGLELWASPMATVLVESLMFLMGVVLYMRTTHAVDGVGRWGWWGFVMLLTVVFVMNAMGAPPPSVSAIAYAGILGGGVSVFLAWWVDRHRRIADAA
jgi:hypothetical protein